MDKLYKEYIKAREKANQIQDELFSQGATKDEIFNHPDWLAAVKNEHDAYETWITSK